MAGDDVAHCSPFGVYHVDLLKRRSFQQFRSEF
ncbi:hypothetical protein COLO4_19150 [Corchorus olitorius]|uniref:Uncharacterized protein n=1 Tax=Corchorus olitorius TaxID=93759 RepID=A0A1R3J6R8_9ROSI|nr:hypothetical protein COLO4_19150 [Corchorus olitorius]